MNEGIKLWLDDNRPFTEPPERRPREIFPRPMPWCTPEPTDGCPAGASERWCRLWLDMILGRRDKVLPMSRAALACGADGLIVEVHPHPDRALSDGPQSLTPAQFAALVEEARRMTAVIGRSVAAEVTAAEA